MNRHTRQANEKKKNKSSPLYQIDTLDGWDASPRSLWSLVLNSSSCEDETPVPGDTPTSASPLFEHGIICQRSAVMNFCTHLLTDGVEGWSSERASGPSAKDVEFLGV